MTSRLTLLISTSHGDSKLTVLEDNACCCINASREGMT